MRYLLLLVLLPACSPVGTFCQAQADCDENGVILDTVGDGDDSVNVCIAQNNGQLRTLRSNEEDACAEVADKLEIYMQCAADVYAKDKGDACDPFRLQILGQGPANPCDDELGDFAKASDDAGGRCSPDET